MRLKALSHRPSPSGTVSEGAPAAHRSSRRRWRAWCTTSATSSSASSAQPQAAPSAAPAASATRAKTASATSVRASRSSRPGRIVAETITRAVHGFNQPVEPGGRERLAQPPDMDVYRPLVDEDVLAPDVVEQLLAGIDTLRVGHEEPEEAKLGRREIHRGAARGGPVRH